MTRVFTIRWTFLVLLAGVLFTSAQSAVAVSTGALSDKRIAFTVTRNGNAIGSQVYNFVRKNDKIIVNIQTDIDFKFLSVPLYRFEHESREVWQGNRLLRLVSKTNDNGDPVDLDVRADGNVLKIEGGNGEVQDVDSLAVPASLWNEVIVKRNTVVDTVNGKLLSMKVADLGDETIMVAGEPVAAHHYRLSGEYNRDVWYDKKDGSLLKVSFKGPDGSDLEYVRQQMGIGSLSSTSGAQRLITTSPETTVVE